METAIEKNEKSRRPIRLLLPYERGIFWPLLIYILLVSIFWNFFYLFLWAKWSKSCIKFKKFIKSWIILLKSSKFLSFLSYSSTESRDFEFELGFCSFELRLSHMNFTQNCSCPVNKSKLRCWGNLHWSAQREKYLRALKSLSGSVFHFKGLFSAPSPPHLNCKSLFRLLIFRQYFRMVLHVKVVTIICRWIKRSLKALEGSLRGLILKVSNAS